MAELLRLSNLHKSTDFGKCISEFFYFLSSMYSNDAFSLSAMDSDILAPYHVRHGPGAMFIAVFCSTDDKQSIGESIATIYDLFMQHAGLLLKIYPESLEFFFRHDSSPFVEGRGQLEGDGIFLSPGYGYQEGGVFCYDSRGDIGDNLH